MRKILAALVLSGFFASTVLAALSGIGAGGAQYVTGWLRFIGTADGSTDNTSALQSQWNAATTAGFGLYIAPGSSYYKVISHVTTPSNGKVLCGLGAILQMPSIPLSANTDYIFGNTAAVSNVEISNCILKSTNDQTGDGFQLGSLTSNVFGMYFQAATNLRIHDNEILNMVDGIKVADVASSGVWIERNKIYNTAQPILMSYTSNFHINDNYLDGTGFNDSHLHGIYFEKNNSNGFVNHNHCVNNVGGSCMQLYQTGGTGAQHVQITQTTIDGGATGFIVQTGAADILIDGFDMTGVTRPFAFDTINNVKVQHGVVNLISLLAELDAGITNVTFSDITVDGTTQTTANYLFTVQSGTNLILDNIHGHDFNATTKVISSPNGASTTCTACTMQNSSFQWTNGITGDAIAIRNTADNWLIKNNEWINSGTQSHHLNSNKGSPLPIVRFVGNRISGFSSPLDTDDTATESIDTLIKDNGYMDTEGTVSRVFYGSGSANNGASPSGNVAIGNTAPAGILDVEGTVNTVFYSNGGSNPGNVGIGKAPSNGIKLDVSGTVSMTGFQMNTAPANGYFLQSDANGRGTWAAAAGTGTVNSGTANQVTYYAGTGTAVSGQTTLIINGTNVGIGSVTPGQQLDVQGTARFITAVFGNSASTLLSGTQLKLSNGGGQASVQNNSSTSGTSFLVQGGGAVNSFVELRATSGAGVGAEYTKITYGTAGGSEAARFAAGNLGIGSTVPGQALDIQGTIRFSTDKSCSTGLTTNSAGDITGCVASDERLKTGIMPLMYDPQMIFRLNPVTYKWKDNRDEMKIHNGFVAQQVAKVLPQAVVPAGGDNKGVDPNAVLSIVVREEQEQRKRMNIMFALFIIAFAASIFLRLK